MENTLVLCANPALELTYFIHGYRPGFISCDSADWQAGGKGINVARVLNALGAPVHLVHTSGGHLGAYLEKRLEAEHISTTNIDILEEIRASVVLVPSNSNDATIIRYPGFPCTREGSGEMLRDGIQTCLPQASGLCIAGSLPTGMNLSTYEEICLIANDRGCPVFLDCYGPLLRRTLEAQPHLVKTNRQELEDYVCKVLPTDEDLKEGLTALLDAGAHNAIVTLGAEGALASLDGSWYRLTLVDCPSAVNPVGAGDAFMAGLLYKRRDDPMSQLKYAGTIAVASTRTESSGRLPPNVASFHRFIEVDREPSPA